MPLIALALIAPMAVASTQRVTAPVEPPASGDAATLKLPEPQPGPPPAADEPVVEPAAAPAFDPAAYRAAVQSGMAAMQSQDWATASTELEKALQRKPDSREVAYNLGVSRFQQGDYAGARQLFQRSAQGANADLAARSMYNQGNATYAEVLKSLPPVSAGDPAQAPQIPPEQLQQAVSQVESAFTHFKDAAAADPSDEDSVANAETSLQLLKELRKIQQQQQQQQQSQQQQDPQSQKDQPQPQQQQQNQQPQSQQEQDQDQKQQQDQQTPQPSQGQNQQSKDQSPQQDQSQQPQESQPNPQQKEKQEQPQQEQQQQQQQQQQQPQQQPDKQPSKQPQQGQGDQAPQQEPPQAEAPQAVQQPLTGKESMERDQTERLLQMVRDKEKARNDQRKQAQGPVRQKPVDKDW